MSEWWTYHPSNFLMFSARTYWRLFELANAAAWPWQLLALGGGLAGWIVRWRDLMRPLAVAKPGGWARSSALYLAVCAAASGWIFLHQRFADINWPADGLALAFGAQALGLVTVAALVPLAPAAPGRCWATGMTLGAWALVGQPLLGWMLGRPWPQLEVIGIAPDPTATAMLGWLLLVRAPSRGGRVILRVLWAVPVIGLTASAAILATMGAPQAWVLPIVLAVAAAGALGHGTRSERPLQTRPAPPPLRP
jgi:hypothetical protein